MGLNIRTKYNGQGIYAIVNIRDLKVYIGSTDNIRARGKNHECTLKAGQHPNKELQKDYNDNKKLDFVLLEKTNYYDNRRLFSEYCYMYEMLQDDFKLYNIMGCRGQNKNEQLRNLEEIITRYACSYFTDNAHAILDKKYHGLAGYKISRTYRERQQTKDHAADQEKTNE